MGTKYDILEISTRAKKDAEKGNVVINATVGTLRDDNHLLIRFPEVIKGLEENATKFLEYAPILGPKKFADGVLKYVFDASYEQIMNKPDVFVAATLGGTGAIYTSFKYFSKKNGIVILPDVCWPNNFTIAAETGIRTLVYPLIKDNLFNFEGLKKCIENALISTNEVLIYINDPCENPTGYSFTPLEYEKLFDLLKAFNIDKKNVDVFFDIAYMDYASKKAAIFDYVRDSYDFNIYFAFSASKSFGVYGIRCGALIGLMKSEEQYKEIAETVKTITRGSVSSPNNDAVGTFGIILNDNNIVLKVREEIRIQKEFLKNRTNKAKEIFISNGIEFLPFSDGFFFTILTKKDAYALADQLEYMHIYVVPTGKNMMRIAICGITVHELELIVRAIKNFSV